MIVILMTYNGLTLQEAIDFVGECCRRTINNFIETADAVPSQDPETDAVVQRYIGGLRDWIVGYVIDTSFYSRSSLTHSILDLFIGASWPPVTLVVKDNKWRKIGLSSFFQSGKSWKLMRLLTLRRSAGIYVYFIFLSWLLFFLLAIASFVLTITSTFLPPQFYKWYLLPVFFTYSISSVVFFWYIDPLCQLLLYSARFSKIFEPGCQLLIRYL